MSSSTSRTAERMEAIVKKHSDILWWPHQANESSRLRKGLIVGDDLDTVVLPDADARISRSEVNA